MKNVVRGVVTILLSTFLLGSTGAKFFAEDGVSKIERSRQTSTGTSTSLDIIFGGPFVFVKGASCSQASSCVAVWVPKVKGHMGLIGLASDVEFKQFVSGNYDFTAGIRSSNSTAMVTPVVDASIYTTASGGAVTSATPKTKPFATLLLPNPREIVSWNADPITISSGGSAVSPTSTHNLATLTIFRYDYQQGDTLPIKSGGASFWTPQPLSQGTERVILVGFVPENPPASGDEHLHAKEAFHADTSMLGLKWNIQFTTPTPADFTRNRPLDSNWPLPPDLLSLIDNQGTAELHANAAKFVQPKLSIFGRINDCKAPAILITQ